MFADRLTPSQQTSPVGRRPPSHPSLARIEARLRSYPPHRVHRPDDRRRHREPHPRVAEPSAQPDRDRRSQLLVLGRRILRPKIVLIGGYSSTDFKVSPYDAIKDTTKHEFTIGFSQVQADLKDVAFCSSPPISPALCLCNLWLTSSAQTSRRSRDSPSFRTLVWLTCSSPVTECRARSTSHRLAARVSHIVAALRAAKMLLTCDAGTDRIFDVKDVTVNIDALKFAIRESKHSFLISLFKPLAQGLIKKGVAKAIEGAIREGLYQLDAQLVDIQERIDDAKEEEGVSKFESVKNSLQAKKAEAAKAKDEVDSKTGKQTRSVTPPHLIADNLVPAVPQPTRSFRLRASASRSSSTGRRPTRSSRRWRRRRRLPSRTPVPATRGSRPLSTSSRARASTPSVVRPSRRPRELARRLLCSPSRAAPPSRPRPASRPHRSAPLPSSPPPTLPAAGRHRRPSPLPSAPADSSRPRPSAPRRPLVPARRAAPLRTRASTTAPRSALASSKLGPQSLHSTLPSVLRR